MAIIAAKKRKTGGSVWIPVLAVAALVIAAVRERYEAGDKALKAQLAALEELVEEQQVNPGHHKQKDT